MINAAALHADISRLGRETAMMTATIQSLSDEELRAPSLCEGWTRAQVIAHLASNGRTLVKLIDWAESGEPQQLYASPEARAEDIARYAAMPRTELIAAFTENAQYFAEQAQRLAGQLAVEQVDLHGKVIPAPGIVGLRIAEVIVHHHDLDTTWTLEEADIESLLDGLEAAVRTMKAKEAPGMTLRTEEGEQWVIGDGALRVDSDREGLLAWLARGDGRNVEADGPLPQLPTW